MTELWLVDLDRSAPALEALERELPRLTTHDRDFAATIKDAQQRRWRLAATAALRLLLERVAGPGVRGQLIVRALRGRPALANDAARFSLSHADGLALVGVTRFGEIGVDLEKLRPLHVAPYRREGIIAAGAGLSGRELEENHSDHAFLQSWCRLEAFTKAQGKGLAVTLAELGLRDAKRPHSCGQIANIARRCARKAGLRVKDVALAQGLFGAIALSGTAMPTRVGSFPTDRAGLERLAARPAHKVNTR
jgi:4'-phosphopantetheinyl transferase